MGLSVVRWRRAITIFSGSTLLILVPGLLLAFPLSASAWSAATWQERCQGVRTSYNPEQDLSDHTWTLTPADARWPEFLAWVAKNRVGEHFIEGVASGSDGTPTGVTVHWAPDTRWERHTRMSFGYAIAYLVGQLGWQDSDFPRFFTQYGGVYGINLKDRLALIDPQSSAPWQNFFRFLQTSSPTPVLLARMVAVNPEKRSVTITAGQGRTVEMPYERYATLLGQVLTDCRAYEFFQAYDRQSAKPSTGQRLENSPPPQEAVALSAAAVSGKSKSATVAPPIRNGTPSRAFSRGRTLYEQECSVCHGVAGDGKGPFADALLPRPRNFTMGLFRYRSTPTGQLPTDEDLYRVVARGLPGTAMPSWGQFLSREQIQEVIGYLKGFSQRFASEKPTEIVSIPPVPPRTTAGLTRGRQLFADMGCGSCHGDDGKGQGSAGADLKTAEGDPVVVRDLTDKWSFRDGHTPADVFRRLSTGLDGSPMPSYRGMVTDEELWDLVFYILSLSPVDRPRVAVQAGQEKKSGYDLKPEDWGH